MLWGIIAVSDIDLTPLSYPWLKSYPDQVKWDEPIPVQPLYEMLDDTIKAHPERIAIHFLDRDYTYQQIGKLVDRTAKGLQQLGVKKNSRVGLFMPNCPAFVIFYYAISKAGGTIVNYNPLYAHHEIVAQIDDSYTEFMVTLDLKIFYDKLSKMVQATGLKKLIICPLGSQLPFPKNLLFPFAKRDQIAKINWDENHIRWDEVMANDGKVERIDVDIHTETAVLQYTGGTTGIAKGALLSHANITANVKQTNLWYVRDTAQQQIILAGIPFFHVFAMTVVMNLAIRLGGKIVMIFPRFDVDVAMQLIQQHKVTLFPAVPTIFTMINNHPNVTNYDLTSLKFCLSGGAPLAVSIKQQFENLTHCKLLEAYGLSETAPAVTCNPLYGDNKDGSIGVPLCGTIIKIMSLNEPRVEMPLGERGEICIKGPQVMKGYWNRPTDSKNFLVNDFFHTGDIGYMDDQGYVFLVDRAKDLILCSGYNVYPRNVETAIYLHPDVDEVTVIGVPDEKRGETVKAFVKIKTGRTLSEATLKIFLETKLSKIEQPQYIEFRDTLPRTLIGKLSKKELVLEELEKRQPTIKQ